VTNGFRRGHDRVDSIVRKAIGFYCKNPRGKAAKIIRRKKGLVGIYNWTDDLF
jgi:hypothetical protein